MDRFIYILNSNTHFGCDVDSIIKKIHDDGDEKRQSLSHFRKFMNFFFCCFLILSFFYSFLLMMTVISMINLFKFFNMQHKSLLLLLLLLLWNSSSDRYEFYNLSLSNYTYTQNLIDRSINGLFLLLD